MPRSKTIAVHRHKVVLNAGAAQLAEVRLHQLHGVAEWCERHAGEGQRLRVGVHAQQQSTRGSRFHDRRGVAAGAQRAVYVAAAGLDRQVLDSLL